MMPNSVPVAIVIPCFNEEDALPTLAKVLEDVRALFAPEYSPEFIFVDDGSTDSTLLVLRRLFDQRSDCVVVPQAKNRGIAAAILNGVCHARADVVCSMDSDCTYDPRELKAMIAMLTGDVQVVTASPYHRRGRVLAVPAWRLWLSKAASAMYRLVLHQKLATYTSCFRVYRRSAVAEMELTDSGFAGVAEMLGRLDLQGAKIVEYPTTLRVRTAGHSKMKLLRTILAQLRVIAVLAYIRWFSPHIFPGRHIGRITP